MVAEVGNHRRLYSTCPEMKFSAQRRFISPDGQAKRVGEAAKADSKQQQARKYFLLVFKEEKGTSVLESVGKS